MSWFNSLIWPEGVSTYPALLLVVVLAARILPLPVLYHPLTLFSHLATRLAIKVNPDPNRAPKQLLISGSLALLLAWLLPMALVYSLYLFSELPLILDALLLYCSLDWHTKQQQAYAIQQRLQAGQLTLAREQAQTLLCRQTSMLSAMGISKAILESLTLRSASQFIGVLFWFLLGGGLAALGYRLVLELQQQWNTKLRVYRYFAAPVAFVGNTLSAVPKLCATLLLAIQFGVIRCYRQCRQTRLNINRYSFYLLCCASVATRRSLGGPVYYGAQKQQRSKIVQQHEPQAADISALVKLLQFSHLCLLIIIACSSVLQLVWHRTY